MKANSEISVGEDGVHYVELTTIVEQNKELIMYYDRSFWMDPDRWATLGRVTQLAILAYYKCHSPDRELRTHLRFESSSADNAVSQPEADTKTANRMELCAQGSKREAKEGCEDNQCTQHEQ